jgi:hypothetical protein
VAPFDSRTHVGYSEVGAEDIAVELEDEIEKL